MPDGFVISQNNKKPENTDSLDAFALARLVSNVTEIVSGTKFVPMDDSARGQSICGRMVMLPIPGARDINVVLSCDTAGGQALAAALGCRDTPPSKESVNDAIAELLNMVAGQIQSALEIDQQLGLPKPTTLGELSEGGGVAFEDSILLTSDNLGDLKLWVFERTPRAEAGAAPPTRDKGFRSLFRKLSPRR
jgi:hypothetical protein